MGYSKQKPINWDHAVKVLEQARNEAIANTNYELAAKLEISIAKAREHLAQGH